MKLKPQEFNIQTQRAQTTNSRTRTPPLRFLKIPIMVRRSRLQGENKRLSKDNHTVYGYFVGIRYSKNLWKDPSWNLGFKGASFLLIPVSWPPSGIESARRLSRILSPFIHSHLLSISSFNLTHPLLWWSHRFRQFMIIHSDIHSLLCIFSSPLLVLFKCACFLSGSFVRSGEDYGPFEILWII